ncbi:MAG: two-component regulator propeller domain-containing protein [Bacteroidota bacterium]
MRMRLTLVLLTATTLAFGQAPPPSQAVSPHVRFERFSQADGLSQTTVRALLEDRHGFLWVGTRSGLDRFDGYGFTNYRTRSFDPTSIPTGPVYALHEARDGGLWVGTTTGIARMDPAAGTFQRYDLDLEETVGDIFAIVEGPRGHIWIAMGNVGVLRLDPTSEALMVFRHDPADPRSVSHPGVRSLLIDERGHLWAGAPHGLNRMDTAAPERGFERYLYDAETKQAGHPGGRRFVSNIYEPPNAEGVLWLATGQGPARFDVSTGQATYFPLNPTDSSRNGTTAIAPDPLDSQILWVATEAYGIGRFDVRTGQTTLYGYNPTDPFSLSADKIASLHMDRAGVLWAGSANGAGLNKLNVLAGGFQLYRHIPGDSQSLKENKIFSVTAGANGHFWAGTLGEDDHGALHRIDRTTGQIQRWTHAPTQPGSLPANAGVSSVYQDRTGHVWMGTMGGNGALGVLDLDTGKIRADDSTGISDSYVISAMLEDEAGRFWIGTERGLNQMDRSTRRFTRYLADPQDSTSLTHNMIIRIFQASDGLLWIATFDGLSRMDPAQPGVFTQYRHDPDDPNSLSGHITLSVGERAREPGVLWIGMQNTGLNRLDTRTGHIQHYTMADGLPDNTIYGIMEDEDGRLWLTTNNGLARFNPDTGRIKVFGIEHGLQAQEFNAGAFAQSDDGWMYVGGVEGLNAFHPAQVRDNPVPPQVLIERLTLFGTGDTPAENAPVTVNLRTQPTLTLAHNEHNLTFDFVGLHFARPAENTYAIRLDPYDTDWRDVGTQRTATYTNLDQGTYTFHVRAANSDGVWGEAETPVQVTIRPPWWETVWAYGIYLALFLSSVYAANRLQRKRLIRRERQRAEVERVQLRAEAAELQAHATEAQAQALRAENERHRIELEKKEELEQAFGQLQRTQQQLVHAEKMASLGQLTAGIAHELKNPLNFVNNFAELNEELAEDLREVLRENPERPVEEVLPEVDPLLDYLTQNAVAINQNGRRADAIVYAMMQHASTGTGARVQTDVNALVEEHVALAHHGKRARIPQLSATLERHLAQAMPPVELMPQEIGRVVLNLVGNALDAVHAHAAHADPAYRPTVTVGTRHRGEHVEIRVSDNGPGVPPELREKIFEPFFTTKPTGTGTGLGLSLSYDIVTQGHGGTLALEHTAGAGATFVVTLPLSMTAAPAE